MTQHISFVSARRFGVELEVNSFDGENRPQGGKKEPEGIQHVAAITASVVPDDGVEIRGYEHTNGNTKWIVKPDGSCGMEIVSPPLKGWRGLKKIVGVADALRADPLIQADQRCSVHVHIEVNDLTEKQLASVVSWWIKCEPVFLDAMPLDRKLNRYCQSLGMNPIYQHDGNYDDKDIIVRAGDIKYYTLNTYGWVSGSRKTIEFRPIEGAGVRDPYLIKNWIRLLIHFVETTAAMERPIPYVEPKTDEDRYNVTPWTSLVWMDPEHVLSLLGFNNIPVVIPGQKVAKEYTLSKGMQQTRNWFLARLMANMSRHSVGGMRHYANVELERIIRRYKEQGVEIKLEDHISPKELDEEQLYGDSYRI